MDVQESQAGPHRRDRLDSKRATRACLQCRQRKQRCAGPSQIPCSRCADASRSCSFEHDLHSAQLHLFASRSEDDPALPLSSDPIVRALQTGLAKVLSRVETLESLLGADNHPLTFRHAQTASGAAERTPSSSTEEDAGTGAPGVPHKIDMGSVVVNHSAVRTVGLMQQQSPPRLERGRPPSSVVSATDPVKLGLISMKEGQQILDIFWEHCHQHAPLLCQRTQTHAYVMASSSPFLFTACLTVGARYWRTPDDSKTRMHPKYDEFVKTMDANISGLILRPEPSDASLATVQGLLLYLQWTPMDGARSRFGDNAVWLMCGIAGRIAALLDLQNSAIMPFSGDLSAITDEDMGRMRTWLNLTSNDHFIWLVTNLAPTLDTTAASCARAFASHPRAQQRDMFAASLAEVCSIADKAVGSGIKRSLSELDAITVRRANEELSEWEQAWRIPLAQSASIAPASMPQISLRWYQLAINRAHANACLSGQRESFQCTALLICVNAAADLLFSVSAEASDPVALGHRATRYHPFSVDPSTIRTLFYTVDYHWVIHAFAASFLALAYQRGAVDAELNLIPFHDPSRSPEDAPADSLLCRLLTLGVDLFEEVCAGAISHPAGQYCDVLRALVKTTCALPVAPDSSDALVNNNPFSAFDGPDMEFLNQLGMDDFTYTDFRDSVFSFKTLTPGPLLNQF